MAALCHRCCTRNRNSDECHGELRPPSNRRRRWRPVYAGFQVARREPATVSLLISSSHMTDWPSRAARADRQRPHSETGRASCREREWQYVQISVVYVYIKKKTRDKNYISKELLT